MEMCIIWLKVLLFIYMALKMVPCDLQKEESEHSKQLLHRVWQKRKFITWGVPRYIGINFFLSVSSSLLPVFKSFIVLCRDNSEMLSMVKTKKDLSGDYHEGHQIFQISSSKNVYETVS